MSKHEKIPMLIVCFLPTESRYAAIIEQRKAEFREQYGLNSSSAITHSLLDAENRISDTVAQGERITKVLDLIVQQLEAYSEKLHSGELSKEDPCVVILGPDSFPWLTPDDQKIIEDLMLYIGESQKNPSIYDVVYALLSSLVIYE